MGNNSRNACTSYRDENKGEQGHRYNKKENSDTKVAIEKNGDISKSPSIPFKLKTLCHLTNRLHIRRSISRLLSSRNRNKQTGKKEEEQTTNLTSTNDSENSDDSNNNSDVECNNSSRNKKDEKQRNDVDTVKR